MLDALPLQENILTNQLIVNTTNEQLQPMTIQYVDDFDDTRTQDVCTLNLNGARVLSSYTNATPITTNGTHEFDVVDSNINMPIMNYQVTVNVPQPSVYDVPVVYTTKRITSNGDYVLGDFVNDNITNYTYLHKNIPVVIDVSTMPQLMYLQYNSVNYTISNFTKLTRSENLVISNNKTMIYIYQSTDYLSFFLYENNKGTSTTKGLGTNYYYKIVDYADSPLYFLGPMYQNLLQLDDYNKTDEQIGRAHV